MKDNTKPCKCGCGKKYDPEDVISCGKCNHKWTDASGDWNSPCPQCKKKT